MVSAAWKANWRSVPNLDAPKVLQGPREREQSVGSRDHEGQGLEQLTADRLGAFLAVRRSDAQWAAERRLEEIISAHLWRY
jgi:hypothetical protein